MSHTPNKSFLSCDYRDNYKEWLENFSADFDLCWSITAITVSQLSFIKHDESENVISPAVAIVSSSASVGLKHVYIEMVLFVASASEPKQQKNTAKSDKFVNWQEN